MVSKLKYFISILVILLIFVGKQSLSQQPNASRPLTRILFVFDGSRSMLEEWDSDKKINIARKLLTEMVDSLQHIENIQMALRVYGHQKPVPPQDCSDTKLEVPFGQNTGSKIMQRLLYISPKGTTPIAQSLELAATDFPQCEECRNIIILITDGVEACDGDPCAVSLALQRKGIMLKPFVIGIGLDLEFKQTFECVGQYYNAASETQFRQVLDIVISQALNSTSAQINLLDINGNPTETDVNMTFYDKFSGRIMNNYIHTINHRGFPDTVILDPLINYRMVAHTIPPVFIDSIKLTPGKHTVVATDASQGYLIVSVGGRTLPVLPLLIVRKQSELQTLNVQSVNETVKYIVGKYDLEILTLPRTIIPDVDIRQSHTTTVQVPQPGTATIQKALLCTGSIYILRNNEMEWVCNIHEDLQNELLLLQPGNYRIIYRGKHIKETIYSVQKAFTITSGGSELIRLN